MKRTYYKAVKAFRRFFGLVRGSFDAVRQTWGERSWMFQSLQDAWMEIDALSRMELQRIHGGLIENSCIVQKIRNLWLQFSVGPSGLICTPNASQMGAGTDAKTAVESWNHSRSDSWERWFRKPELNSEITGGQLTRVWSGLLFDTGEIFINLTQDGGTRGVNKGSVPKVQTIDSHRCQTPNDSREYQGRAIVDGVEVTEAGEVVAYWFKKSNFANLLTAGLGGQDIFDRIPLYDAKGRKQIIHKFKVRRPGQRRGIPEGFSVYNLVRDNMDLHKLEMQAAKLASDIANVEYNGSGELDALTNRRARFGIGTQNAAGQITTKNATADYNVSIGSKNIAMLQGSSLQQFMISRPTVATQDYWDLHYTLICMGYNVPKLLVMPYSMQGTVTRADLDISGYGFGREAFEIVSELLREVYEWQTAWAVDYDRTLDGEAPADYVAVVIRPPRAPNVDVGYNASALETELKLGVKTIPDVYSEKQQDWRQKVREIAEFQKYVKDVATEFGVDAAQITELAMEQVTDNSNTQELATADNATV